MGLRFFRRVKLFPGLTLNLTKTGSSVSFGGEGAKYTIGRGGSRWTTGLPGTGLYYTKKMGGNKQRATKRAAEEPEAEATITDLVSRTWLQRLFMGDNEKAFVDGMIYLDSGLSEDAMDVLGDSPICDCQIPAGFLAMRLHRYKRAAEYLEAAYSDRGNLGLLFGQYGIDLQFSIPVTPWMDISAGLDLSGLLFSLVEVYQIAEDYTSAFKYAALLRRLLPDSAEARLSHCELIFSAYGDQQMDRPILEGVLKMLSGIENEGPVESALLMYRARAMRLLGQPKVARAICQDAMRKKKDRPAGLIRAIRLERALCFRDFGQQDGLKPAQKKSALDMARVQLNHLYSETPDDQEILNALQTV